MTDTVRYVRHAVRMNVLQFIAAMTGALAWPTAAVTAVLIFRKRLADWLTTRPESLKFGPFELLWAKTAVNTQEALDHTGLLSPRGLDMGEGDTGPKSGPAWSVIQASTPVEAALRRRLLDAGVGVEDEGLTELLRRAVEANLVSGGIVKTCGRGFSGRLRLLSRARRHVRGLPSPPSATRISTHRAWSMRSYKPPLNVRATSCSRRRCERRGARPHSR
jgi:hypothetical protein